MPVHGIHAGGPLEGAIPGELVVCHAYDRLSYSLVEALSHGLKWQKQSGK